MENDPDPIAAVTLKISNEADSKIDAVGNNTQGMRDTVEGVLDGARNVDKVQTLVNEVDVSGVNGAQTARNRSSTAPSKCLYIY